MSKPAVKTLGELKQTEYKSRSTSSQSVKQYKIG